MRNRCPIVLVLDLTQRWCWMADCQKADEVLAQPLARHLHQPSSPAYFVGRVEEKEQLHTALARRIPSIISVIGIAGQGKTTLVHQVLRERHDLPFAAGLWCTAYRGGFSFDVFLDEALSHLTDGAFDKQEMPGVEARVARLLDELQQRPVLLVVDGMERWLCGWNSGESGPESGSSTEERTAFHAGLDDFLEQASGLSNGSHLILTSRAMPAVLEPLEKAVIPVRDVKYRDLGLEGLDPDASVGRGACAASRRYRTLRRDPLRPPDAHVLLRGVVWRARPSHPWYRAAGSCCARLRGKGPRRVPHREVGSVPRARADP